MFSAHQVREEIASASMASVADGVGEPCQRVVLLPIGPIQSRDDRAAWRVDDLAHARRVIDATQAFAGRQDLPIDYDHQSECEGASAPAAGWIKPATLRADAAGISAEVVWTDPATARLKAREYRYLSPVFGFEKATRRVTRIKRAALTNTPALEELPAVAAQEKGPKTMFKTIAAALGLTEDADETAICAAITELKAAEPTEAPLKEVAAALGLKEDASAEEVTAAAKQAKSATPDPKRFVPKEGFDALSQRLETFETERRAAAVDQAVADGKLAPSMKQWGLDLHKSDETAFASYLDKAPRVIEGGRKVPANQPDADSLTNLSDEEKAACRQLGVAEDAFLKTKKANLQLAA